MFTQRRTGRKSGKKAVAPVLATLLMIAVAVAMSVIIFMWSQGFLSQTSESTGSQQGSQNQAAQSSVSIEVATFSVASNSATLIIRNVGAVAVTLGSITASGLSSNAGFSGTMLMSISTSSAGVTYKNSTGIASVSVDGTAATLGTEVTSGNALNVKNLAKASSVSLTITAAADLVAKDIKSGDTITFKVTTAVGTFAQSTFTVP